MPAFGPGQVHVTGEPFIQVDPLPAGVYTFRLQVVDAGGNVSAPVDLAVTVVQPQPVPQPQPTPIPRPTPSPFPRTSPIGRVPLEPVERPTNIPIFKRTQEF